MKQGEKRTPTYSKTQLVVNSSNGDLRHYGALNIMLSGTDKDWEAYGQIVVQSVCYMLDVCLDEMIDEDKEELFKWMAIKLKNGR